LNVCFEVNLGIVISEKCLTCDSEEFGTISSELLKAGKTIRFTAKGASMHPLIRDGDIVLVTPLKQEKIHKGDVVLFTVGNGRALLHRVVRIRKNRGEVFFYIQGDHNNHSDGYISKANIHGLMVAVDRGELQISANRFVYRKLGRLASLYLRTNRNNSKLYVMIIKLLKQLPLLRHYLS